jgi:hypothetical protein
VRSEFDLQELVADSILGPAVRRRKRKAPFALGPLPLDWWVACDATGPHSLSVALAVLSKTGQRLSGSMKRQVAIGDEFGKRLKLSRDQRRRAVAGLEAAGLIEVERKPNHAPRVRLLPWRSEDGDACAQDPCGCRGTG